MSHAKTLRAKMLHKLDLNFHKEIKASKDIWFVILQGKSAFQIPNLYKIDFAA